MVFSNVLHRPSAKGFNAKGSRHRSIDDQRTETQSLWWLSKTRPLVTQWPWRAMFTMRTETDRCHGSRTEVQSGLEAASSWMLCLPSFFHLSACPHLAHTRVCCKFWHFRGTESTRRVPTMLPLADVGFRLDGSGSYCPVWTLAQTRCWLGSCVSSWRQQSYC